MVVPEFVDEGVKVLEGARLGFAPPELLLPRAKSSPTIPEIPSLQAPSKVGPIR